MKTKDLVYVDSTFTRGYLIRKGYNKKEIYEIINRGYFYVKEGKIIRKLWITKK